ncbi:MAG TPA: glycosyltransferase family 39 protein [Verrucomicrobiae bacterium]|nr:glycosyltransferase family 39 protein [Verrucomicrobiae bacterium]
MSKRTNTGLLIGIICLGFLLRLAGVYWTQGYHYASMGDEMLAYRVALNLEAGQERAQYIGQPNFKAGKVPGPLWALFWVIGLKIGGSAEAVSLMMVILNACVIYLVYRLAENIFGPQYSLWAALFFATSPWPVHYSITAWNPIPMAFLGALLYLALWDVTRRPNSRNVFWVCLMLAIMPQFHMMVMFIAPVVALLLWWSPSRLNAKWLVAGVLTSALLYIPYVTGEMRHGWQNTQRIFFGPIYASFSVLKILTLPITNLSNLMSSVTGRDLSEYRALGEACFGSFWVLAAFNAVSLVLSVLVFGSFVIAFFRSMRGNWRSPRRALAKAPADVFVGMLLLLPLALFISSLSNFNSRYLIVQFPLLFVLPALFIVRGVEGNPWRGLVRAAMVVTIVFNVIFTLLYFRYESALITGADYFLPSFRKMETVRQELKADAGPDCRVRIDDKAYLKMFPAKYTDGVADLAKYVDLREEFDPLDAHAQRVKTYQVRPLTAALQANERVVCATNGIALVTNN